VRITIDRGLAKRIQRWESWQLSADFMEKIREEFPSLETKTPDLNVPLSYKDIQGF